MQKSAILLKLRYFASIFEDINVILIKLILMYKFAEMIANSDIDTQVIWNIQNDTKTLHR